MSDSLWYTLDRGVIRNTFVANYFLKTTYFLSATVAGYFCFVILGYLREAEWTNSTLVKNLIALPSLVHFVMLIINLWNPIFFYIDENMVYHRGSLFVIQYIFIYAYIITSGFLALIEAFDRKNYLNKERLLMIAIFPVLPAICGILQLYIWRIPFECLGMTISVMMVFINCLKQQISQDGLTGLKNRKEFLSTTQHEMRNLQADEFLFLFMIDANDFKKINDENGHKEGDRALLLIAQTLDSVENGKNKRWISGRFGGDEFLGALVTDNEEEADKIVAWIKENLAKIAAENGIKYDLSLSIGYSKFMVGDVIQDLLARADKELYREKKEYHSLKNM